MMKCRKRIEQTKGCCPHFRSLRAFDAIAASAFWTRISRQFGLRVNGPNDVRVSRTSSLWAAPPLQGTIPRRSSVLEERRVFRQQHTAHPRTPPRVQLAGQRVEQFGQVVRHSPMRANARRHT